MRAYKEEGSFWSQKSRDRWLKDGDENTKYFHASIKANRAKKTSKKLEDENGNVQRAEASKADVVIKYLNKLFASSYTNSFQDIFRDFQPKVN